MATRFPNCRGKIDGRRISIIALNHESYSVVLRYHAGESFSPMCTSDGLDSCTAPGFWQTLISIAEVRKRYCSEIENVQIEGYRPEIRVVLLGNPA